MSDFSPIFMQGDKVFYTGQKHKMDLSSKEGKPYIGWIHAAVGGSPDTFVVWFPDTKHEDSYIMGAKVLSKYRPAKTEKQQEGPEIQPRRRKKEDD